LKCSLGAPPNIFWFVGLHPFSPALPDLFFAVFPAFYIAIYVRWDYDNKAYYNVMDHLVDLKSDGKIRNIGLTNFDTVHMADLKSRGVPIVSNQVLYATLNSGTVPSVAKLCCMFKY
jgi:diketogulonate reductase-like aldo/keto reductase